MLKKISTLGSTLNKTDQKSINGGAINDCAHIYSECDRLYPNSHSDFSACMTRGGCVE